MINELNVFAVAAIWVLGISIVRLISDEGDDQIVYGD